MFQELYRNNPFIHLPLVGLVVFMALFFGMVVWLFIIRRTDPRIDEMARLPLAEETTRPTEGTHV